MYVYMYNIYIYIYIYTHTRYIYIYIERERCICMMYTHNINNNNDNNDDYNHNDNNNNNAQPLARSASSGPTRGTRIRQGPPRRHARRGVTYNRLCVPRACVSMLLQFHGARKHGGQIKALLKRSIVLTKPLILGIGASKVLPSKVRKPRLAKRDRLGGFEGCA